VYIYFEQLREKIAGLRHTRPVQPAGAPAD
jgi:hypothetical protein